MYPQCKLCRDREFSRCRSWTGCLHPVIVQRGAQFGLAGRRHPCRGAHADFYGPSIQKVIEILLLQYIDKVIDVWCRSCSSRCIRGGDSRAPTVAPIAWIVVAMPVIVQRQLLWSRRLKLRRSRSSSTSSWSMSLLCRFIWRPFLDKVVDMPVIVDDMVADHSGGASDTVHRLSRWTFQLCSRWYDASSIFLYGGDEGVFDAFCVIFRAPLVVPELSASFWSPRWRRVLRRRGLPCQLELWCCGHTHSHRVVRTTTTTVAILAQDSSIFPWEFWRAWAVRCAGTSTLIRF